MFSGVTDDIRLIPAIIAVCLVSSLICVALPWYSALLILLLALSTVLFFMRPGYALYLLIFLVVVTGEQPHLVFKGSWATVVDRISILVPFLVACGAGRLAIDFLARTKAPGYRSFFHTALFLLIIYACSSIYWSSNWFHSIVQLAVLLINILVYFFVVNSITDLSRHRKVMWCVILSGAAVTVLSYCLKYMAAARLLIPIEKGTLVQMIIPGGAWRLTALGWSQNDLALTLNFILPIVLGMFLLEKRTRVKVALMSSAIMMLSAILLTMSRGAVLALIVAEHFFFLASSTIRKKIIRNLAVAYLVLATVFCLQLFLIGETRTPRVLEVGGKGAFGFSSRFKLWQTGLQELISSNGIGMGIGGFNFHCSPTPHAHSIYFDFLFDLGIIGFITAVCAVVLIFRFMLEETGVQEDYIQTMRLSVLAGLLSIGVHGLIDFGYTSTHIWLFFALSMATCCLCRTEKGAPVHLLRPAAVST